MRFTKAKVTNYKCIDNSECVDFNNVTCLVGKNESGKTAFLRALQKISPLEKEDENFQLLDYPRKGFAQYKRTHELNPATVVSAEFELSQEEIHSVKLDLGLFKYIS